MHGFPRLGSPRRPFSDLVIILASNRTSSAVITPEYKELRSRFPNRQGLAAASPRIIALILRPAGLAQKRARSLVAIARTVTHALGRPSLAPLHRMYIDEIATYITRLPRISKHGPNAYRLMVLYAVLSVEVHVHRLTLRLGWQRIVERSNPMRLRSTGPPEL